MRIAIVADQFFRPTGVGVYSKQLLRHLFQIDQHNEYIVLYPGKAGAEQLKMVESSNVRVCNLPERAWLYPSWHLFGVPAIERLIGPCDLVHVLSGSVRLPCQAPLLVTIHDLASERLPHSYPWRRRWFKRRMLVNLGRTCAKVVSVSEATRRDVIDLVKLPAEQIFITYEGVDRQHFQPPSLEDIQRARKHYHLPERYFLFLGAISPRKNADQLLRSFERYALQAQEQTHLVVAGPPLGWKDGVVYQLWDQLNVKHTIHFIGYVSEADLPAIYGGAHAFIYPSRYEGFGLPILEAMACGTPVICSNTSSTPEVAGDAALLVNPDSTAEIVAAMQRISTDHDLRRGLIEKGFRRAEQFSWEKTARQTLDIYESMGKPEVV